MAGKITLSIFFGAYKPPPSSEKFHDFSVILCALLKYIFPMNAIHVFGHLENYKIAVYKYDIVFYF